MSASETALDRKVRREVLIGRYVANPAMRALFRLGLTPPWHTLLETTGRVSGRTRRAPVGYGRSGDEVWVIAQHGARAGWVRNLQANPRVRLLLRGTWRTGTAQLVPDDDVQARVDTFSAHPFGRRILRSAFSALETRPCSVRIDLTPEA
jgi:deazaflavin-dependent oxidoreductase (nitroreductase family)